MHQPLITIVTVAYNSQQFIRQAVQSVLSQSYQNFEYLILDDCSIDNTWSIIEEYKDTRIFAIRNEINIGEYYNRNKAVSLAKGKYLVFVDGDDVALNRGIELAISEMERHPNCGFAIISKREDPKFIGPIEISSSNAYNLEYFGGGFLDTSLSNNIYQTKLLQEKPFLVNYTNADTFTRLNLLKSTNVLVLINRISIWRLTDNQKSKKIAINNQLMDQIKFIYNDIFNDNKFTFFDKNKIKPRYYKLLVRLSLNLLKKINIKEFLNLRKYYIDNYWQVLVYSSKHHTNSFWNEYTYYNLNIEQPQKSYS